MKAFKAVLTGMSLILFFAGIGFCHSIDSGKMEIIKAIHFLKSIDPSKVEKKDQQEMAKKINQAWDTIKSGGKAGIKLLKKEIDSTKNNDYFKLNSCALLWLTGKLDEANYIGKIWRQTNLAAQYNYVFYPAFEAASQRDLRVIPMLVPLLKETEGKIYVYLHAMKVDWPLTLEFIWGQLGSWGVPALERILEESEHVVTLQSAIFLLTKFHSVKALPKIRMLAKKSQGELKQSAILALGTYGHPQDFDLLITGLKNKNPETQFYHVYALYEYEDLRAVPDIIPLLNTKDDRLLDEVLATLQHLLTPDGVQAIIDCSKNAADKSKQEKFKTGLDRIFKGLEISPEEYYKLKDTEKMSCCDKYLKSLDKRYVLKKEDKKINRDMFLKIIKKMTAEHRISLSEYEWFEDRHLLSTATLEDLNLLIDLRGSIYKRLSDECLYETRTLDQLIKRIGRTQYRKNPGIMMGE
jgi:hypothetical protein